MRLALPKTFRGCWKRPGYVRRYKAAWQAIRRQDPEFHENELLAQERYRQTPRGKKTNARVTRRWKRKHAQRVRRANQRWHERHRVRRCFFCGKKGKSGRGALQRVMRMVPDLNGRLAEREVDYCGSC